MEKPEAIIWIWPDCIAPMSESKGMSFQTILEPIFSPMALTRSMS